jgi:hypothetical protein
MDKKRNLLNSNARLQKQADNVRRRLSQIVEEEVRLTIEVISNQLA